MLFSYRSFQYFIQFANLSRIIQSVVIQNTDTLHQNTDFCISPMVKPIMFTIFAIPIPNGKNMENTLLNIETVTEYNDMLNVETLHPQVSVIDLSKARPMRHMRHTFSFYVVFLKDEKNCDLIYGRQRYDYQKGSVVCLAPGQVIGIEDTGKEFQPQGYALCFHPDLIRGTNLGRNIKDYSFSPTKSTKRCTFLNVSVLLSLIV